MFVKFKGFAPDKPDETPGILKECDGFLPTVRGMESIKAGAVTNNTLTATCVGGATLIQLDNNRNTFLGTSTQLYKANADATYTDVSRTDTAYAVPSTDYWTFSQYGNVSFAANVGDRLQHFVKGDSVFTDLTATVSAKIVEVANDFVFLFNTGTEHAPGGVSGLNSQSDRWHCSGIGDYTNFTPSIQAQCATNRLTETYGRIEAAKRFGDDIIVYKERSMYVGRYIGPPFVWSFNAISDEIGATGVLSVVPIGDPVSMHIFIGYDDIYLYDGSRPRAIGTDQEGSIISEWFFSDLKFDSRDKIIGLHERESQRVIFFYPSNEAGGSLDKYIAYNYSSNRWGAGRINIQMAFEYFGAGITYHGVGTQYATYNDLPNVPYDLAFQVGDKPLSSYVGDDRVLYAFTADSGENSYITNDFGEDESMTLIDRVRPRFSQDPDSATQTIMYRDSVGTDETTLGSTAMLVDGAFDQLNEARWQSFKHVYQGNTEIVGINLKGRSAGSE